MNAEHLAGWTLEDVNAHCQRFGLKLPAQQLQRMHELSAVVSETGLNIARMPSKSCEPALTFVMPTE